MRCYHSSMCRIAKFDREEVEVRHLRRAEWHEGDYVVAEVDDTSGLRNIELTSGRLIELGEGDLVIGALGTRYATLEATGSWKFVEDDGKMHILTTGGVLGVCTSRSSQVPPLIEITYRGHVFRDDRKVSMKTVVPEVPEVLFETPVIVVIGTSMSAGKTTAARIVIRQLKRSGMKVVAAKLTGAGRFRDVLSMYDAGADYIFDFVDVGLPTTVVEKSEYESALSKLLSHLGSVKADVAVIEVGASPLEPYNGTVAMEAIDKNIQYTILCASDPYAVVGVQMAYDRQIDLVSGIATNTKAGAELVEKLSGLRALNVRDKRTLPELRNSILSSLNHDLQRRFAQ
ncbi:MAG: DUF1611 domain-containing protein [Rhodothermales bacterium]|nr:DUF1611 domain-containing protein [Rhodothermales bacterium]